MTHSPETQREVAQTVSTSAEVAGPAASGVAGMAFDRGFLQELEAQVAALRETGSEATTEILASYVETLSAMFDGLADSVYAYRKDPHQAENLRLALRVQGTLLAAVQAIVEVKHGRVPRSNISK